MWLVMLERLSAALGTRNFHRYSEKREGILFQTHDPRRIQPRRLVPRLAAVASPLV